MGSTVLVVEDEISVLEVLRFHLEHAGYEVRACMTARDAWAALPGADVVVLDWMLPDESGLHFLRRLRGNPALAGLPVLMLTARANETDRVEGLDAGADDYLTKPFGAAELAARIRALLRRSTPNERGKGRLQVAALEVDLDAGTARIADQSLELTRREFELLAFLASHPGRVYARQELLDRVWGTDFMGGERTVDQHITQLRAHLGKHHELLETVRGRGYRMRGEEAGSG